MTRDDIIRKVKKLRTFVALNRGDDTLINREAENAARLADRLEAQYKIEKGETQEKRQFRVKYSTGMKDPIIILKDFLGIQLLGNRSGHLWVECTPLDYEVFEQAYTDMREEYNRQYRQAMKKIRSNILGYAQSMYRTAPRCRKCGGEVELRSDRRYYCVACDYVSGRVRSMKVDYEEYLNGMSSSKKLIK